MQMGKFLDSEISPPDIFRGILPSLHKKYSIIVTATLKVKRTLTPRDLTVKGGLL